MINVLRQHGLKISIQNLERQEKMIDSFYLFSKYRDPSGKSHKSQIKSENELLLVYLSWRGKIFTFQP